jgi:uncharacterized membrane protein YgcG
MTTALATPDPNNQPKWLTVIPDSVKAPLAQAIAALKPDEQKILQRAIPFVRPELLEVCETADEALEILKGVAESVLTDDQANYIPAVYTINHKTQRFQDDLGDTIKGPFRAVILHFQPTRGWFIEGRKLPLCSAIGNLLNGTAQKDAQDAWSSYNLYQGEHPIDWAGATNTCATCWFNEFGSDPKTGAGKACKEKYRLFLALVDADCNLTGEGVMMNVPTTSMKNWDTFVSGLKRHKDEKGRLQPLMTLQVVTEFTLEKAQGQGQDYAKITPKMVRALTGAEFQQVYAIRKQIVKVAETLGVEVGESYDQVDDNSGGGGGGGSGGGGSMGSNIQPGDEGYVPF